MHGCYDSRLVRAEVTRSVNGGGVTRQLWSGSWWTCRGGAAVKTNTMDGLDDVS
jgi:hypothetical protein